MRWPNLEAVVPITDPAIVRIAQVAGIGSEIEQPLGGTLSSGICPFRSRWVVAGLGDGRFVQDGPYLRNEPATLGDTAILRSGNLTVLAMSLPGFTQDPAAFRSQGIDLADKDGRAWPSLVVALPLAGSEGGGNGFGVDRP